MQNMDWEMSLLLVKSLLYIVAITASNKILNCLWWIDFQQKTKAGVNSNSFGLRENEEGFGVDHRFEA